MTYQETLHWLFTQLPMYQRDGGANYKIDLESTIALCYYLKHPERGFKSIHIAGTNGKGSCAHLLANIFEKAGYKTGLYTSPHLKDFRERIRINQEVIPEQKVVDFISMHKKAFSAMKLSFFEMTVGMAFDYFRNEEVDIAIIETGMGGRLDSTNVLTPELSIVTNIGMDHMQFLGDTRGKIAGEKAGIMKAKVPVVLGESDDEIEHVFREKAQSVGTELYLAEEQIGPELYDYQPTALYQYKNLKTVLASIKILKELDWKIEYPKHLNPFIDSGLSGRFQIIGKQPKTIADGAHNVEGIEALLASISDLDFEQLWFVIGMVNDKKVEESLEQFPDDANYIYCQAEIPRAMDAERLKEVGASLGRDGLLIPSVKEAISKAREMATNSDLVVIGGSFFVVAEAL